MTTANMRPTLGLAAHLDELEAVPGLRDFLFDRDRDLEIRDLVILGHSEPDHWHAIAARARRMLNGHRGRVGIHGPYEGLMIETPDPEIRAIVQKRMQNGLLALAAMQGGKAAVIWSFTAPTRLGIRSIAAPITMIVPESLIAPMLALAHLSVWPRPKA